MTVPTPGDLAAYEIRYNQKDVHIAEHFMSLELARVTTRGQTTIPKRIRESVGIRPGDLLAFERIGEELRVRRVSPDSDEYLRAVGETMSEWSSKEDESAWRDL